MKYLLIYMMIMSSVVCNAQAERAKEEPPLKVDPNGHRRVPIIIDRSKKSEKTEVTEDKRRNLNHKRKTHRKKKDTQSS